MIFKNLYLKHLHLAHDYLQVEMEDFTEETAEESTGKPADEGKEEDDDEEEELSGV